MTAKRFLFFWVMLGVASFHWEAHAFVFGKAQTKRERADALPYEKILESFLKEDYAGTTKLTAEYLSNPKNKSNLEDVLYLQSLSLLKLGRADEAREKLKDLEKQFQSSDAKASAAASVGDSYFYEGNLKEALQRYRETLSRYPQTDQTAYLHARVSEISGKLAKPPLLSLPPNPPLVEEKPFYTVQVGAFSRRRNAAAFLEKLLSRGYPAYLEDADEHHVYRVRIGKYPTKAEALAKAARLNDEGYPTKVIP
jgi:tetratricopeptide (TPR) repeat protein